MNNNLIELKEREIFNVIKKRCINLGHKKIKNIINNIPNVNFEIPLTNDEVTLLTKELEFTKEGAIDSICFDGNIAGEACLIVINTLLEALKDFEIYREFGIDGLSENKQYYLKVHLYELDYFFSILEIGINIAEDESYEVLSNKLSIIYNKAEKHYLDNFNAIMNFNKKYSDEKKAEILYCVFCQKHNL